MTAGTSTFAGPLWKRLGTNRSVGVAGIVLGVVACLLALPPITARSIVWSALVGLVAVAAGSSRRPAASGAPAGAPSPPA